MKKNGLWAGVDLGVETARVCVIDSAGEVLHEGMCPSAAEDVRHELGNYRRSRFASVAMEAGVGTQVARGLRSRGYPVELFEARQLSKFLRIRRNKTDAGDAKGIAEAGRIGASIVSKVYLKSLESQMLQSRLAVRRHLIGQRVAAVNMLARQIEVFGGRLRCSAKRNEFRRAVEDEMHKLFSDKSDSLVTQLRYLADYIERLIAFQRALDRILKHEAIGNEVCRRLMEIPGVGPICALTFYAAIDDPYRFTRSKEVGSYFGLAPKLRQSGLTSRTARISKMGNKSVRSLLVHAAGQYMHFGKGDSDLRTWTLSIEQRRGRAPSRVALARKLAVIMLTLWKSGCQFERTQNQLNVVNA